jgi:hypothetical protein
VRSRLSIEEQGIKALLKRKREYEKYFKTLLKKENPETDNLGMDHQAQTAYTNIIKTLVELSRKAASEAKDPERLKRLAEEILENDYGIERKL